LLLADDGDRLDIINRGRRMKDEGFSKSSTYFKMSENVTLYDNVTLYFIYC